jgi:hypothetical protein
MEHTIKAKGLILRNISTVLAVEYMLMQPKFTTDEQAWN